MALGKATVFERGFATQIISQIPKIKALLSKAFILGILKSARLI